MLEDLSSARAFIRDMSAGCPVLQAQRLAKPMVIAAAVIVVGMFGGASARADSFIGVFSDPGSDA